MMSVVVEAPAETADKAQIDVADSGQTGIPALDKPEGAFAAPCNLKTAPSRLNEADDNYPRTAAQLNARWRVIDSMCGLQWILQRRDAGLTANWRGSAFCRTRDGLLSNIKERCGQVHEARLRAIEQLPVRHP